jgi:transposase-like protein
VPEGGRRRDQRISPGRVKDSADPQVRSVTTFGAVHALEGELDDHLGYARHDPESRDGGNCRNWHRVKTVLTEARPVEISVLRDRDS